jgi:hypothetical protein
MTLFVLLFFVSICVAEIERSEFSGAPEMYGVA